MSSLTSRARILNKLSNAQKPFADLPTIPAEARLRVALLEDANPQALYELFVDEAQKLHCHFHAVERAAALDAIIELLGGDTRVLAWDSQHIPVPDLASHLAANNIQIAAPQDGSVRVGITGIHAAIATTGSLILMSGEGCYRSTSLLPDLHIAVMTRDQIYPDLETWMAHQRERDDFAAFRQSANTTIITGPSKTADIGGELIEGAHGPIAVHILCIEATDADLPATPRTTEQGI